MFDQPSACALLLKDMKATPEQRLYRKFVVEESHKYYGPYYYEDSRKA